VLFLSGLRMIFPPKDGLFGGDPQREPRSSGRWPIGRGGSICRARGDCAGEQQPGRAVD